MNDYVVIIYNGEQVSVPKEVADFLEQDRKRQQAQDKQDARHLSKSEFETVPSGSDCVRRPVEDAALRNLQLENLRKAIAELDVQGQNLLSLRYSDALTMDEIGQIYGISKMAVSKRLKKLHEKLGSPVMRQSFPAFCVAFSAALIPPFWRYHRSGRSPPSSAHRCIGGRAGSDLAHPVPQWLPADFQAGGS